MSSVKKVLILACMAVYHWDSLRRAVLTEIVDSQKI
jgi:hypothetical protein